MSHRRRYRRRPNQAELIQAVVAAARAAGCDCDPEVVLDTPWDGVHAASIGHDDWCSLLRRQESRWN